MTSRKKILLIEAPFNRLHQETHSIDKYPMSLAYLAGTIVRETDWTVRVYNADFSPNPVGVNWEFIVGEGYTNYRNNLRDLTGVVWNEVRSVLSQYYPDVVGITSKSQNFASAALVARLVKELNRDIIVVVGGPHPTLVASDVLKSPDIDACVRGEGEVTIVELLDSIARHDGFGGINGVSYKDNGKVVNNPPREYISDLDTLCFPHQGADKMLLDYEKYPIGSFKAILATRGCPYGCTFCGSRYIWSRKVRFRSPGSIIEEIKLLQKMGLREVHFDDDTFGVNRDYIKELCDGIAKHCPGVMFTCEIHPNLVDDENISVMKRAGCSSIYLGVESGSNEILKAVKKRTTIEKALAASEIIRKHGISLSCFFMVGFPQETEETLIATREAIKKVNAHHIIYSTFCPYPATELFEYCRKAGLVDDDFDVSLYNHHSPENRFYTGIEPERFKEITREIVEIIDLKNRKGRLKQVFSRRTIEKIKELGVAKSLQKGAQIMLNK